MFRKNYFIAIIGLGLLLFFDGYPQPVIYCDCKNNILKKNFECKSCMSWQTTKFAMMNIRSKKHHLLIIC